jgi:hypothetical protein
MAGCWAARAVQKRRVIKRELYFIGMGFEIRVKSLVKLNVINLVVSTNKSS